MMTEQEYINVCDLTRVRNAYRILSDVIMAIQPALDGRQWRGMMKQLASMEVKLVRQVKTQGE